MSPQEPIDKEMEKRLFLAVALSMAVLFLAPYLYRQFYPAPVPPQEILDERPERPERPVVPAVEESGVEALAGGGQGPFAEPETRAERRVIEVENDSMILRWNTVGGSLESARLKEYLSEEGEPLELIPQEIPPELHRNLSLGSEVRGLGDRLPEIVYEAEGIDGDRVVAPAVIRLHFRDAEIEVTRRIEIPASGYLLKLVSEVRSASGPVPAYLHLGPGLGALGEQNLDDFPEPKMVYYQEGDVTRLTGGEVLEEPSMVNNPRWVALDSKYFSGVLLGPGPIAQARLVAAALPGEEDAPLVEARVQVVSGGEYAFYLGPKVYESLLEADTTLGTLVDYGMFAFLVRPLLFSLKAIHQVVGNYGWAIIILTFVINVALFPVRYKQMSSMKKMSVLQPQIKAIQDKYKRMKKTDPRRQKMNEEVMALYKEHGVNPLGGCLPLVIQMPFLFAFYRLLYVSIELRGAPFILWITDLSRHDPYYVTPILMGVTMVFQQQMTPGATDPTQRKMMMLLPVVFTFFFLNFSSGLVIYFLFSNLFGMMFQVAAQRWKPELAPKSKPAKK